MFISVPVRHLLVGSFASSSSHSLDDMSERLSLQEQSLVVELTNVL
ncbi:MAG: hypothetical protein WAS27_00220 [Candidatus Saccharimonadales bacterium]